MRSTNLLPALLLLLALLSAGHSASALASGESLVMPLPPPESGWTTRTASTATEDIAEWIKPETGDAAAARILRDRGGFPPAGYRQAVDTEALSTCSPYGSREISASEVNGYPYSLWIAQCSLDFTRSITVLHLYISGIDQGYYLTRKWRGTPPNDLLELWVDYFAAVEVCDSRPERNAPCPD